MSDLGQCHQKARVAKVGRELKRGRESYGSRAWGDAYRSLSVADRAAPLDADDLELLATSAYLIGREDDYLRTLERAHHAYLDAANGPRAVRCAFWLGLRLVLRGETGPGTGWLARAGRLLERGEPDCVEQGFLLLPIVLQHIDATDWEAAYAVAAQAIEIGDRFAEPNLTAAARHLQGRVLLRRGQVRKGLALLDEAMIAVHSRARPSA